MKKVYESDDVSGLEKRVSELETEVRAWHLHGVYLTLEEEYAVWERKEEEERAQMDEEERREAERIDDILQGMGF